MKTTATPAIAALAAAAFLASACESQEEYRMGVARRVFDRNCAGCHGSVGGDGPSFVGVSGVRAPDLFQLTQKYGSPIPRDRIAEFIDGRAYVEAHGPRDMPVWGDRLYENLGEGQAVDDMRAGTIELLLDYIEAHQAR